MLHNIVKCKYTDAPNRTELGLGLGENPDSIKHRLSGLGFGKTQTGVQKSGPATDKNWTRNKGSEYENGIQNSCFRSGYELLFFVRIKINNNFYHN